MYSDEDFDGNFNNMKILQPSGSGGIVFIVVLSIDKRKYFLYSTKTHIFFICLCSSVGRAQPW